MPRLLVKMGGAAASEIDFTDYVGRKGVPFFEGNNPVFQMGHKFATGEAAVGNFILVDPDSELPADTFRLRPHARVNLVEDASGTEYTIASGRIAPYETGRRGPYIAGDEIEHDVTVMDRNLDLRGIPFRNGWSRPAETDIERLEALQAAKLNGSSSTNTIHRATTNIVVDTSHFVDGSAPIDLEAHDYPAGTHVDDVVRDIAEQADKLWGVVPHHVDGVGTHNCLQYIDADDHTTNLSTVKISDDPADNDPDHATAPVYEPNWQQGKGRITDNDFVVSGIIGIYDGTNDDPSTVFVESGDDPAEYETWVDVFNDGDSPNATVATRRANYHLRENKRPRATHRVSVLMLSSQLHLLEAGQSVETKSAVINSGPNKDSWINRRVAQIIREPAADGLWWAHLQLERPKRGTPPWRNKGQPKSTSPKPPTPGSGDPPTPGTSTSEDGNASVVAKTFTTPDGSSGSAIIGFTLGENICTAMTWDANGSGGGGGQSFTKLGDIEAVTSQGFTQRASAWFLLNPNASAAGDSFVSAHFSFDNANAMGVVYLEGVNTSDPYGSLVSNGGTGSTTSISVPAGANQTVVNFAGWMRSNLSSFSASTPVSGQTQAFSEAFNNSPGQGDIAYAAGYGDATPQWTLDASREWLALAIAINGSGTVGDSTEPVGDTGEGSTGSNTGTYAPIDHVHEHGDLSTDDEHHHDASDTQYVPKVDSITSETNVQGALGDAIPTKHAGAPTADDDAQEGYIVGSRWLDTTNDVEYIAWDVTVGAAVWETAAGHAEDHASRHADGGADEVAVESLPTSETDTDLRLAPDGSGGVEWAAGGGGDTDEKAKVSANDTTAGYLNGKLVAGSGVSLTENNDGGNETLTIAATGGGGGGLVGKVPYALPPGYSPQVATTTQAYANGLTIVQPIYVPGPMAFDGYSYFQSDGASAREVTFRLYRDNGDATIDFVTGTGAVDAYTAAGGTARYIACTGAPVTLDPGVYWLVVQVSHASNGVTLRRISPATGAHPINFASFKAAVGALGATLDMSSGWSKTTHPAGPIVALVGRVWGEATPYFTT